MESRSEVVQRGTLIFSEPKDLFRYQSLWMKDRIKNVLELSSPRSSGLILDLGCGMGTFTVVYSILLQYVVGVDFSPSVLSIARQLIIRYGKLDSANLVCADVRKLPLRGRIFHSVISADLVEHLTQPIYEGFLRESKRTLRDDGRIFIYTPNASHVFEKLKRHRVILREDAGHVALRTLTQMVESIEAADLKVLRAYYRPSYMPMFELIERALSIIPLLRPYFGRRICVAVAHVPRSEE